MFFEKKVFLEIPQNWEENTSEGFSLIKLQAPCSFNRKETLAEVFSCKYCKIFKDTCFKELVELEGLEEYTLWIQSEMSIQDQIYTIFPEQYYLWTVNLWHNDKNSWFILKKKEI